MKKVNPERLDIEKTKQACWLAQETGLRDSALALFLEVSKITLSYWLNGKEPVPPSRLIQMEELIKERRNFIKNLLRP